MLIFRSNAMASRPLLLLFLLLAAIVSVDYTRVAAGDPVTWLCGRTGGRYKPATAYYDAVLQLATTLPKTVASSSRHFATASAGTIPDRSIAVALCRGDADDSACWGCVAAAFQDAFQKCPYIREATVFHDLCLLKFSDMDFLAAADGFGEFYMYTSDPNANEPGSDDGGLEALLQAVANYTSTHR